MHRLLVLLSLMLVSPASPAWSGPDEELLGKAAGYPIGTRQTWFLDESVRVGSFSRLDTFLPHHTLQKATKPLALLPPAAAGPPLDYRFEGRKLGIDDFLARQRITGLLVIKDGQVLAERYQYDRTAGHRLVSHSMAKSIVSLGIGLGLQEKKKSPRSTTRSANMKPDLPAAPTAIPRSATSCAWRRV